ncbi:MAG: DUF488 family protein [Sporichthyaceae bacterium]
MDNGVVGVGYEGRSVDEFVALLQREGVQVLVDARLIPRCSRRGFSRHALAEILEPLGISYVHYEILGVPEFDQVGFRGDRASVAAATARYRARLGTAAAQRVVRDLIAVARVRRVGVMTMFADPERCHRGALMAEIERRTPVAAPIDDVLAEFARPAERTDGHCAVPEPEPVAVDARTKVEQDIDALLAEFEASRS